MKFSSTLSRMLSPLTNLIGKPMQLCDALAKDAKRGKTGTYYPGDVVRLCRTRRVILETRLDNGAYLFATVIDGNFQGAIEFLAKQVEMWECYIPA